MNDVLWYSYCKVVENKFVYDILNIFLHVLSASFMDIVYNLRDNKPVYSIVCRTIGNRTSRQQYKKMAFQNDEN